MKKAVRQTETVGRHDAAVVYTHTEVIPCSKQV